MVAYQVKSLGCIDVLKHVVHKGHVFTQDESSVSHVVIVDGKIFDMGYSFGDSCIL